MPVQSHGFLPCTSASTMRKVGVWLCKRLSPDATTRDIGAEALPLENIRVICPLGVV